MRAAWCLALALAGCRPTIPEGRFACGIDRDCPAGWLCHEGLCFAELPAAATEGDLPAGDPAASADPDATPGETGPDDRPCVPDCSEQECGLDPVCGQACPPGCETGERCDPLTGKCRSCLLNDPCDDGNECTFDDRCDDNEVCAGTPVGLGTECGPVTPPVCQRRGQCNSGGVCEPQYLPFGTVSTCPTCQHCGTAGACVGWQLRSEDLRCAPSSCHTCSGSTCTANLSAQCYPPNTTVVASCTNCAGVSCQCDAACHLTACAGTCTAGGCMPGTVTHACCLADNAKYGCATSVCDAGCTWQPGACVLGAACQSCNMAGGLSCTCSY